MNVRTPARFRRPSPGHPPVRIGKVGVLLVNLGSPAGTDYWSVRRYLKEFLSDRRVIETSRLIWWPILNGIILLAPGRRNPATPIRRSGTRSGTRRRSSPSPARRPRSCARRSPATRIVVDWAMRYGEPLDRRAARALKEAGLRPHPRRAALPAILRRRRRRRSTTRLSRRCRRCAGSRRSARCRPITTIRSISTRWRTSLEAGTRRRSTSSRRW